MKGIFAAKKEKKKEKRGLQKTVYLVGAGPGAGVTHTGILLAEFLEERRGARTLFLEINNHRDIRWLRRENLSAEYKSIEDSFPKKIELEAYDYVVADLGTDLNVLKTYPAEGALGILIGNGAPWKRERFCQQAAGLWKNYPEMEWKGLLSLGDKKEALLLSGQLEFSIRVLGWQPLYEPLPAEKENLFLSLLQKGEK